MCISAYVPLCMPALLWNNEDTNIEQVFLLKLNFMFYFSYFGDKLEAIKPGVRTSLLLLWCKYVLQHSHVWNVILQCNNVEKEVEL
jgi:hypothetical protein